MVSVIVTALVCLTFLEVVKCFRQQLVSRAHLRIARKENLATLSRCSAETEAAVAQLRKEQKDLNSRINAIAMSKGVRFE